MLLVDGQEHYTKYFLFQKSQGIVLYTHPQSQVVFADEPENPMSQRNDMVAHSVKTPKPAKIRATFLLFSDTLFSMDFAHAR
jgi:hypothetical protein